MGVWTFRGRHHTGSKVKLLDGVQGISAVEQSVLEMLGKGTKMGVGWGEGRALTPMDDKRQVSPSSHLGGGWATRGEPSLFLALPLASVT